MQKSKERAKRFVAASLGRKAQTVHEIREKLKRKEIPGEIAEEVLQEFIELGYLDDREFLKQTVRNLREGGYGPARIRFKLRDKGFSPEEIEEQLGEFEQRETLERLIGGKYKRKDPRDPKQRQQLIGALARRGFSLGEIFSVLDRFR